MYENLRNTHEKKEKKPRLEPESYLAETSQTFKVLNRRSESSAVSSKNDFLKLKKRMYEKQKILRKIKIPYVLGINKLRALKMVSPII